MSNSSGIDIAVLKKLWANGLKGTEGVPSLDQMQPINEKYLLTEEQAFGECPLYSADLSSKDVVRKLSYTCSSAVSRHGAIVVRHR